MSKKILLISGIVLGSLVAYKYVTTKLIPQTKQYLKENISIAISGFKVHKISWSGVELRLTADLINLTGVSANCSKLKADIYYINNGSPSPLATTTINKEFTINPKDTTRVRDIKLLASTLNITRNLSILSSTNRQFKVVLSCVVNGQEINITQNTTA